MVAPRWVARANRAGLNRLTALVAPWAPGWAVVIHRGRRSGRTFRTPLWAFRRGDRFVIALTYGPQADWVRNVLAAGGCELEAGRKHYRLVNPQVFRDEKATDMPPFISLVLRHIVRAPEFLRLDVAEVSGPKPVVHNGSR